MDGNAYASNNILRGGYGPIRATDPTRLSWNVFPSLIAVSGDPVINGSAALSVLVADTFGAVVTSITTVLTLTLSVRDPSTGALAEGISIGGTQTALPTDGLATFDAVTLVAANTSLLDQDYLLDCSISQIDAVSVTAHVHLLSCSAGQGRLAAEDKVTCASCAAGTIGVEENDFVCTSCPAGTFAASVGSSTCTPCAVNTFAAVAGASSCTACPAGSVATNEGATDCLQTAAAATGLSSGTVAGTVVGVVIFVVIVIIVVAVLLYRLARRRTMQKYYLDNDATIRAGAAETPLQKEVKKIILANSTTRIGGGLFSNVYKAKYEGSWIALKVVKGDMATNGTAQQEFRREAVALSRLEERAHPGIIQLRFFLQINPMCIGVAYCTGGSLKQAISNGSFSAPAQKVRLAAEAASGLAVIHACNIVHLDIKTDNMLLSSDDRLIVADFGISRVLGLNFVEPEIPLEYQGATPGGSGSRPRSSVTGSAPGGGSGSVSAAGSTVQVVTSSAAYEAAFTPQYVDPLRILFDLNNDEFYLKKADIFSFGVLMWAIYAQAEPFAGENPEQLVERLRDDPTIRQRPLPECPVFYSTLFERCWHADPNLRPDFPEIFSILQTNLQAHYGVALDAGYADPRLAAWGTTIAAPSNRAADRSSNVPPSELNTKLTEV